MKRFFFYNGQNKTERNMTGKKKKETQLILQNSTGHINSEFHFRETHFIYNGATAREILELSLFYIGLNLIKKLRS